MRRCWHKGIAESTSPEARQVRLQNPEINYKICQYKCSGYVNYGTCGYYELRELNPIEEETIEDSSNRLEDIGV